MPDEDKNFGGFLVLDFRKVMTSRENDLYGGFEQLIYLNQLALKFWKKEIVSFHRKQFVFISHTWFTLIGRCDIFA